MMFNKNEKGVYWKLFCFSKNIIPFVDLKG